MKANELRIGNLVITNDGLNEPMEGTVFNILRSYCRIAVDNELEDIQVRYEDLEGIPLTEEWLLKFGFVADKMDGKEFYRGDFKIQLPVYFWWKDSSLKKIKHVHQLQNLYYALTREELEVKETAE